MAIFLSAIFLSKIFKSAETVYLSGVICPETIPSPNPQTASMMVFSFLYEGSFEKMTPDFSESTIF